MRPTQWRRQWEGPPGAGEPRRRVATAFSAAWKLRYDSKPTFATWLLTCKFLFYFYQSVFYFQTKLQPLHGFSELLDRQKCISGGAYNAPPDFAAPSSRTFHPLSAFGLEFWAFGLQKCTQDKLLAIRCWAAPVGRITGLLRPSVCLCVCLFLTGS